ncbi:MAG: translation initiation factor eIF-1A [Candidatus Methanoliparum thermophilum]|uniref:Translation initiation factor 1A n=1 Tax=Methanoliparum thermophilum TaxID=2491083 RepID=A0A520KRZ8_METT2|nr:MAG: translation initiation factor eIF-1A [Candidatus Methanoliparum thermophilum]
MNNKKFVKHKKKSNNTEEVIRVYIPKKEKRELFGLVEQRLGSNHLRIRCSDGVTRICRIPGRLKGGRWLKEDSLVVVTPWEVQDSKGDITWIYTKPQRDWLIRNGYLKNII